MIYLGEKKRDDFGKLEVRKRLLYFFVSFVRVEFVSTYGGDVSPAMRKGMKLL